MACRWGSAGAGGCFGRVRQGWGMQPQFGSLDGIRAHACLCRAAGVGHAALCFSDDDEYAHACPPSIQALCPAATWKLLSLMHGGQLLRSSAWMRWHLPTRLARPAPLCLALPCLMVQGNL